MEPIGKSFKFFRLSTLYAAHSGSQTLASGQVERLREGKRNLQKYKKKNFLNVIFLDTLLSSRILHHKSLFSFCFSYHM